MTDLKARLEETSLDVPDRWRPEEGDVISGRVTDHQQARTRSDFIHVYVITPEDGEAVSFWMDSLSLQRAADMGEQVAIRYEGEHPTTGRDLFRIFREGEGKS